MRILKALLFTVALFQLPTDLAFAQADETGTGSGPLTTEKAPNTTEVGQTKPPSRDASPASVKPIDHLSPREAADDAISARICAGCGAEQTATAPVPKEGRPIVPLRVPDAQLGALRSAPTAKQQGDLDTVALASAHRERAKSTDEKTNGLWQSWLVSVCAGCGDQKPAKGVASDAMPYRDRPLITGSIEQKGTPEQDRTAETKHGTAARHHGLVEALSPENLSSIRRMPPR